MAIIKNPMTTVVQSGGGGGGLDTEIFNRTISGKYSNSEVLSLPPYAFASCSNLTAVDLPNCSNVGASAFLKCSNFSKANLPSCRALGQAMFSGCSNLTTENVVLGIQSSFNTVPVECFRSCSSLLSIPYENCWYQYGQSAFMDCIGITGVSQNFCYTIGSGAFNGCYNLSYVNVSPICSFGSSAFNNCSALESINMLDYPPYQSAPSAFTNCTGLNTVRINMYSDYGAPSLGTSAFYNCTNLMNIFLYNKSVVNNLSNAFKNTPVFNSVNEQYATIYVPNASLANYKTTYASISDRFVGLDYSDPLWDGYMGFRWRGDFYTLSEIPQWTENLKIIPREGFSACSFTSGNFSLCSYVGWSAFSGCASLETINLPNCLILGSNAFNACNKLSIINCENVEYLYVNAFTFCSVRSLTFRKPQIYASPGAFGSVSYLSQLYLLGSEVNLLGGGSTVSNRFGGITPITSTNGSIFVPESLVDAYKATPAWAYYSNRIFGYTEP